MMRYLFAMLLGCTLFIGLSGLGYTESSDGVKMNVTTNEEEEPDPIQEPEEEPEEVPKEDPESDKDEGEGSNKEENDNGGETTAPKEDSKPSTEKPKSDNNTDTKPVQKPKNPTAPPKNTSPSNPSQPDASVREDVEETAPATTEEVTGEGLLNIDENLSLLKLWRENSFDTLYVPVVYDLLRYHYEYGEIIELDHLSKDQLTELYDFVWHDVNLQGPAYDEMREIVKNELYQAN